MAISMEIYNASVEDLDYNYTYFPLEPEYPDEDDDNSLINQDTMEYVISIMVPIIFGLILLACLCGNTLVIVVVAINKQMRSTTNLLILNLAVADLLFISICAPVTMTMHIMASWPFGDNMCKVFYYIMYVTAYASVYTLVMMALDRFLAVVHPISSIPIRTQRNTCIAIVSFWLLILSVYIPITFEYEVFEYTYRGQKRSQCVYKDITDDDTSMQIYTACFFVFAYMLPLTLICILYGIMLFKLLKMKPPGQKRSSESSRNRKHVTRLVFVVVLVFAICWLPVHISYLMQNFVTNSKSRAVVVFQIAANCLAYLNSCLNPILYAFLSSNFRLGFTKVLCCSRARETPTGATRTNNNTC